MSENTRTGGQLVVDALIAHGIDRVFCVPGESYLAVLDALHDVPDKIDVVVCRHEGGAAYMAEAYARQTGKPGICLVTRGPGSCNASIGVLTAWHEDTPLLLIVGHVTSGTEGLRAFQELDPRSAFAGMAKSIEVVEHADRIAEAMNDALTATMSGRPGPAVVALPEDIQFEQVSIADRHVHPGTTPSAGKEDVAAIAGVISSASKPLIWLGGSQWNAAARSALTRFAENFDLPVATTFRRQDLFDNDHPNYVGSIGVGPDPKLVAYVREADAILLLGGQLGEIETARYSHFVTKQKGKTFIHAAPAASIVETIGDPDITLVSDMASLCQALAQSPKPPTPAWSSDKQRLRDAYIDFSKPKDFGNKENPGTAVTQLCEALPGNTIVTAGAGTYTHFVLRHHKFTQPNTLLAPISAPMGYSVPAAIGAALAKPDTEILAYAGDGCFLMNAQELVVAASRNLRITFVILNNNMYGSVRMHQEMRYPHRPVATALENPDFLALANSMGLPARRINHVSELVPTQAEMRAQSNGPILIELLTDPEVITPQRTIDALSQSH